MSRGKKDHTTRDLNPKEIAALLQASHISGEGVSCTFNLQGIFDMIDVNKDGQIDFHESLVVVVLSNRMNDLESRLSFAFDMWDASEDGQIDQKELVNVIIAIYDRAGISDRRGEQDPKRRAKEIIAKLDVSGAKKLSKEEFITGYVGMY